MPHLAAKCAAFDLDLSAAFPLSTPNPLKLFSRNQRLLRPGFKHLLLSKNFLVLRQFLASFRGGCHCAIILLFSCIHILQQPSQQRNLHITYFYLFT
jgi:hypothetical protein